MITTGVSEKNTGGRGFSPAGQEWGEESDLEEKMDIQGGFLEGHFGRLGSTCCLDSDRRSQDKLGVPGSIRSSEFAAFCRSRVGVADFEAETKGERTLPEVFWVIVYTLIGFLGGYVTRAVFDK